MKDDVYILIADDDIGHVSLIKKNLRRSGIANPILHFKDGQEILDFLFELNKNRTSFKDFNSYLLLLDIRMPKVDGFEVLRRVKNDPELKKIPIYMLSTTDDPLDIEQCHLDGCNSYIIKPIKYDRFVESIHKLALFLDVVEVPSINLKFKTSFNTDFSRESE